MANKKLINNAETGDPGHYNESIELSKRSSFSRREVGLTHPDTHAFVKLNDRGEIEIFAGEELGIIISPENRSISIFADVVKIVTKEDYGLRWNNKSFNHAADVYNEPSLVKTSEKEINSGFNYASYYLDPIDEIDVLDKSQNITTINGEYAFSKNQSGTREEAPLPLKASVLSDTDQKLLNEYALTNNQEKVNYMKKLLELGYNFNQAAEKTMRDKGA